MKEIGGYFEFEQGLTNNEWHNNCLRFNSARNCFRYIIQQKQIETIYLPDLLCDAVGEACKKEGINVEIYNIDRNFLPTLNKELSQKEYICIVNYYGTIDNIQIAKLKERYKNIIVDSTHAFFQEPIYGVDTVYNCRKYFGVPDGAYLATDLKIDTEITQGKSGHRIRHLIGRLEDGAEKHYSRFLDAEETFSNENIEQMSKLTRTLMGAISYKEILSIRKENIAYLEDKVGKLNKLKLSIKNMNFMYPLYIDNADKLRQKLISEKVYVPILWPNVIEKKQESIAHEYAKNIIPIPIDQRYNIKDMEKICNIVKEYFDAKN